MIRLFSRFWKAGRLDRRLAGGGARNQGDLRLEQNCACSTGEATAEKPASDGRLLQPPLAGCPLFQPSAAAAEHRPLPSRCFQAVRLATLLEVGQARSVPTPFDRGQTPVGAPIKTCGRRPGAVRAALGWPRLGGTRRGQAWPTEEASWTPGTRRPAPVAGVRLGRLRTSQVGQQPVSRRLAPGSGQSRSNRARTLSALKQVNAGQVDTSRSAATGSRHEPQARTAAAVACQCTDKRKKN